MLSIVSGLLAAWCAALWGLIWQYRRLRVEVEYLPKSGRKVKVVKHPAIGQNLRAHLALPPELSGKPVAVMVTSAKCPACHGEMEEVLASYRRQPIPLVCLLIEGKGDVGKFLLKNSPYFPIVQVPVDVLRELEIAVTPLYLVLDADGVIQEVISGVTYLFPKFQPFGAEHLTVKGGDNDAENVLQVDGR